jgi:hypothetical protein
MVGYLAFPYEKVGKIIGRTSYISVLKKNKKNFQKWQGFNIVFFPVLSVACNQNCK